MPIDLSQVLFICTSNRLDTISAPLLDRCEVIQLSGMSIVYQFFGIETDISLAQAILTTKSCTLLDDFYCRSSCV